MLVLYGEHEPFVRPGELDVVRKGLARALPHAGFAVLPGAGHDLQGEQPELFATAVAEFVSRVRGRPQAERPGAVVVDTRRGPGDRPRWTPARVR